MARSSSRSISLKKTSSISPSCFSLFLVSKYCVKYTKIFSRIVFCKNFFLSGKDITPPPLELSNISSMKGICIATLWFISKTSLSLLTNLSFSSSGVVSISWTFVCCVILFIFSSIEESILRWVFVSLFLAVLVTAAWSGE